MADSKPYNFDEVVVPEYFDMVIDGNTYRMRYPTSEEAEGLVGKEGAELVEYLYSFVTPQQEGAPSLKDALKNKSIIVRNRVQDTMLKEFQRTE